MIARLTRTVFVLLLISYSTGLAGQDPDCPKPTYFKTAGAADKSEYATSITRSPDGALYVGGRNANRTFLQKVGTAGDVLWQREFQISPFEPVTLAEIITDSEGMIVGCGTNAQFAGARRGYVFRYNPVADTFIWAHPIASNNPAAAGILEKGAGGSFVYYQNPTEAGAESEMEMLDLERNTGNIIAAFAGRYEYISDDRISKMVEKDGSLYAFGTVAGSADPAVNADRVFLSRIDPVNGMPLWAKMSHLDTLVSGNFLARDMVTDDNALVLSYSGRLDNEGVNRIYLQKTNLDGDVLWIKSYNLTAGVLKLLSVNDGYVIYGQQNSNEHYLLKTDKSGVPQWSRRLLSGPAGGVLSNNFAPNQAVTIGDSIYVAGVSTEGTLDVLNWKILVNGGFVDSCSVLDTITIEYSVIDNPVVYNITLHQTLTTAVSSTLVPAITVNSMEEHLFCPDCSGPPDPCPQKNDFTIAFGDLDCLDGEIQLGITFCDVNGDPPSEGLSITFYDGNPFTEQADKLETIVHDSIAAGLLSNCSVLLLEDIEQLFGPDVLVNGMVIYAVVNDPGTAGTPFSIDDFPLSFIEECDYTNNVDSFVIQLPTPFDLDLGPDRLICSGETAVLDAGPGFYKYQWSNGQTTQSVSTLFGGQFRVTVTDDCGFRQADTIVVTFKPNPIVTLSGSFCPGDSITIAGYTFTTGGNFSGVIPGAGTDCDTLVNFIIQQLPYEERTEVVQFCQGDLVTINGQTYGNSGLARDTFPSTTGCDTIVLYFLQELPAPFRYDEAYICPGDSIEVNGVFYSQPGEITDTLPSMNPLGCDTLLHLNIIVLQPVMVDTTVAFCAGESVVINGQTYTQPGTVTEIRPTIDGLACDTVITYTLEWLPGPERSETISFCQGSSVDIGGQTYTQPGTVTLVIPGTGVGCDTVVTYTLEWINTPERQEQIAFCPGSSVSIDGQSYTQPGTVTVTVPGTNGACDTLVTYTLSFTSQPTRSETIALCAGETVTLGGQTYTAPNVVTLTIEGLNNTCDTLVTYTLVEETLNASVLTLNCPSNIVVTTLPGTGDTPVNYALPSANSNCNCPDINLSLSDGPASGGLFSVGVTQVCYQAVDACGTQKSCCFTVTVREEAACDTKTIGCMKYELLSITKDAQQRHTYRIRVTNNCANKMIYTAIQLPDGLTAVAPANFSQVTTPEGRKYDVRNPNFTPFYSIRFKSTTDSIAGGQSDEFQYTLPAQSQPTYIHILSRLSTQVYYEAHLNTFNCPVGVTPVQKREADELTSGVYFGEEINLFPNPSSGELYADLSAFTGKNLHLSVLDSRGALVGESDLVGEAYPQRIAVSEKLSNGLYFVEFVTDSGARIKTRFVLQR